MSRNATYYTVVATESVRYVDTNEQMDCGLTAHIIMVCIEWNLGDTISIYRNAATKYTLPSWYCDFNVILDKFGPSRTMCNIYDITDKTNVRGHKRVCVCECTMSAICMHVYCAIVLIKCRFIIFQTVVILTNTIATLMFFMQCRAFRCCTSYKIHCTQL